MPDWFSVQWLSKDWPSPDVECTGLLARKAMHTGLPVFCDSMTRDAPGGGWWGLLILDRSYSVTLGTGLGDNVTHMLGKLNMR